MSFRFFVSFLLSPLAFLAAGGRVPCVGLVLPSPSSFLLSPLSQLKAASPPGFRLVSTPRAHPASGWVELVPATSPFGLAASRDGRIVYDLDITVADLPT